MEIVKNIIIIYQSSVLSIILLPLRFKPFREIDDFGFCNGAKPSKDFGKIGKEFLLVIIEM